MIHRWKFSSNVPDDGIVSTLSQALGMPRPIAKILVTRGVTCAEEAEKFFTPKLSDLHSPRLLNGAERAAIRILRAVEKKETIVVYGDYDVDGTTSAAMMTMFFRTLGARVITHVPDRFTEGYGLSRAGIDRAIERSGGVPQILLSIDCGITAVEQIAYATSLGIDVIVCDHHEPAPELPKAFALLDPILHDSNYPCKFLCGCGVGFKLIQMICELLGEPERAFEYTDLVAFASCADIVPLTDENRILVAHGLHRTNTNPRPGIRALIEASHMKQGHVTSSNIVFTLAPRINAAGRLGDALRAVDMLMATSPEEAAASARTLDDENTSRRDLDKEVFDEACKKIDAMIELVKRNRIIVVHDDNWHAGVIGIVASRCVERYHLPTVLMTTVDGVAKGSARSIPGFDIHGALERVSIHLLTFGGHKYAAGVSIDRSNIEMFRTAIGSVACEGITDDMLIPTITIDAEISLNELNPDFFNFARRFEPYGPHNMKPVFVVRDAPVKFPKVLKETHLKFAAQAANGTYLDAIAFGKASRREEIFSGNGDNRGSLVFTLDENEYQGRVTNQLLIKDFCSGPPTIF